MGMSTEDLREMANRLSKSHQDLTECVAELESEKAVLVEDNASLKQTIEIMTTQIQKLNIGADNTIEPVLNETAMGFVTRMWEKHRPRDTAVMVSEHVGEIKKPVLDEHGNPPDIGQQLADHVTNALAPLQQTGKALWNAMQGDQPKRKHKKKKASTSGQSSNTSSSAIPNSGEELVSATSSPSDVLQETPILSVGSATLGPVVEVEEEEGESDEEEVQEEEVHEESFGDVKGDLQGDSQMSSTILIEAKLKLDDGTVEVLQVRAADRCKEVAQRFVQKHSLKVWFQDPLTEWLKKVENDAVTFPVELEADLNEIRKSFSKKN